MIILRDGPGLLTLSISFSSNLSLIAILLGWMPLSLDKLGRLEGKERYEL